MDNHFDVIVVGGGAVGASTLFHLTRQGVSRVLLLEQKAAYGRGATGAWGSLVRIYHEDEKAALLAMESVPYFLDFEAQTGYEGAFTRTGALYFLKVRDLPEIRRKVERLNQGTLQLELLLAPDGRHRFPAFQWMDDDVAVYESHGGYSCPFTVTESWIRAAQDGGAQARSGETVVDIVPDGEATVSVRTARGDSFTCDKLVMAAGVWSTALLARIGEDVPIVPTVIQVNEFFQMGRSQNGPLFIDLENLTFGHPSSSGSLLAGYLHDRPNHHDKYVQQLSLQEAHEAKRRLSARLNWITHASLRGGIRATEGYTTDGTPILKFGDRHPNVFVAAGWCCTGFTLAPWAGREIASRVVQRLGCRS